jgi:hypothetical protein
VSQSEVEALVDAIPVMSDNGGMTEHIETDRPYQPYGATDWNAYDLVRELATCLDERYDQSGITLYRGEQDLLRVIDVGTACEIRDPNSGWTVATLSRAGLPLEAAALMVSALLRTLLPQRAASA